MFTDLRTALWHFFSILETLFSKNVSENNIITCSGHFNANYLENTKKVNLQSIIQYFSLIKMSHWYSGSYTGTTINTGSSDHKAQVMEVSIAPNKDRKFTQYIKVCSFKLSHKKTLISYLTKEYWSPFFTAVTPDKSFIHSLLFSPSI